MSTAVQSDFAVFDLAAFEAATGETRATLARELDRICRETGFLAISGHGVAPEVIANLSARARAPSSILRRR